MNQSRFLTIFITANVLFILLHIHKHTQIVRHEYRKQELEQQIDVTANKKEQLVQQLCALKNRESIYQYAQHELNMRPLHLNQIKKISAS